MADTRIIQKYYFNKQTEEAIIKYNNSNNFQEKNELYNNYIEQAFLKLTEFLINNYGFHHVDDSVENAQNKTIIHLMEKLDKYDQSKGKAYSYFTTVAHHFLISENKKNYDSMKKFVDITNKPELFSNEDEDKEEIITFFEKFLNYLEENISEIFNPDKPEFKIVSALIEIIRRREHLEPFLNNYNKKAIYLMVREITNVPSIQITRTVAKLKIIFKQVNNTYINTEKIIYQKPIRKKRCKA